MQKEFRMIKDKFVNVIDEGSVFSNPDLVFGYCGWPSIVKTENNELLAVYSGNRISHLDPFGKVILQRSRDEGKTWSARSIVIETPLDDRDAGILALPGGKVLVSTFNIHRERQAGWWKDPSTDSNLSNAYLAAVSDEMEKKHFGSLISVSNDSGFSFEPPFKVPVTAPHGPSLCKDGSVIYAGPYFPHYTHENKIGIYKSGDLHNFQLLTDLIINHDEKGVFCSEPHIIELKSGRLVLHLRTQHEKKPTTQGGFFTILQSVSDDKGKTFSVPKKTGVEGSPPHLLQHSSGTLICTYGRRKPPYGIQAMFSNDDAETWDTNYFIWNRGTDGDLGYPASVELSNGDILTVYYAKIFGQKLTSILWTRWQLPSQLPSQLPQQS